MTIQTRVSDLRRRLLEKRESLRADRRAGRQVTITGEELRSLRGGKKRGWYARASKEDRTADGITFSSKTEMKRYLELRAQQRSGQVKHFHRQPIFDLAGVVYRPDFLIVYRDGTIAYEEVKGRGMPEEVLRRWRRNAKQVEEIYKVVVILNQLDS